MNGTIQTDGERADEMVKAIESQIVAHTLEAGEPWDKKKFEVWVPTEWFRIMRRYYEWETVSKQGSAGTEQAIQLPRCQVRSRDGIEFPVVRQRGDLYWAMNEVLKQAYMPAIKTMLTSSAILSKYMELTKEDKNDSQGSSVSVNHRVPVGTRKNAKLRRRK